MAEYIERKAAINLFYPVDPENDGSDGTTVICIPGNYSSEDIESMISDIPAADVAPVRHGGWDGYSHSKYYGVDNYGDPIYRDGVVYYCSECRRKTVIKEKYCPNCGAKMDGGKDYD